MLSKKKWAQQTVLQLSLSAFSSFVGLNVFRVHFISTTNRKASSVFPNGSSKSIKINRSYKVKRGRYLRRNDDDIMEKLTSCSTFIHSGIWPEYSLHLREAISWWSLTRCIIDRAYIQKYTGAIRREPR